ncbi:MAG TPA: oligosaccharide flippase family protein [Candidatus Saccharimonadales bacterium]|nr:oligosaccharide flippase family protein [Candidatus Saccharimonadales bacterium]
MPTFNTRARLSRLWASPFLRHNAVYFAGSMAIGLLNYLYYPVLGRLMPPGGFGEAQVLAVLLAQVTIFLNVFGLMTVNIVTNYRDPARRNQLILELEQLALTLAGICLVAAALGGGWLQRFFHFDSAWPFIILMLAVLATVPLTFRMSFLRGQQRFAAASIVGVVGSAADLVLAATFVRLGWGAAGAMWGLVAGQLAAYGVGVLYTRKHGLGETLHVAVRRLAAIRLVLPEARYAGLVFVCSLGMTALYSIDSVAVKHYFDARTAGLYAGIATIARIIFFLTASVAQVLLPSVKLAHRQRQNLQVLGKSFLLLLLIGGSAQLAFLAAPQLVVRLLMGSAYLPYAYLLPRLSLALFVMSVVNLLVMYHLALRHRSTLVLVVAGFAAMSALLYANHGSLAAIVDCLAGGSLTTLALIGGWAVWSLARRTKWTPWREEAKEL